MIGQRAAATHLASRVAEPCYSIGGINLVRDANSLYPDVQISYSGFGGTVENLTAAKVIFFNRGREAIRRGDIAKTELILIRVRQGGLILGVNVLYSKPQNQFTATRSADRTHVKIDFEFLDHGDGAVIQVMHTGVEETDLTMEGLVIGGSKPRRLGWKARTIATIIIVNFLLTIVAGMFGAAFMMGRFENQPLDIIDWILLPILLIWFGFRYWEIIFKRPPLPIGRYSWMKPFYRTKSPGAP